jgi:hypothetical protein
MQEGDIQTAILNYLVGELGIYAWRNNNTGVFDPKSGQFRALGAYAIKGVADILGVLPDGKLLAIEVKTAKGRVSKHQKAFISRVNKSGGLAFVARSVDEVKGKLSAYL